MKVRQYDPVGDYMNDICECTFNHPDDLILDLNDYIRGIGVQYPPTMVFFPNEEDDEWPVDKPFETVGFESEFDDNTYFISYQEFYDMLSAAIEKGMKEHSDEVKSKIRACLNAFKDKHRLV